MKNFKRISAALILAVAFVISSLPFSVTVEAASTVLVYSKDSNSGKRDVVCTTLEGTSAGSYYTGNYTYDKLDDLSGSALFDALQTLMRSTHTYIAKYDDDCRYKANKTDCEENNGKVTLIYTSYQATMEQWNGWNREHVWPQSLGPGTNTSAGTKNGGADMHHVRPVDKGVNSSRGNKPYGNSNGEKSKNGSDPAVGILGGTYNSTYFEPNDNVKGDVARICLYMYVRWNTDWGCDSLEEVFESIEILLQWCKEDPVDTWEMGRNEVVGALQGNRNVFIDYPELAWLMLGYDIPEGMSTPSGKASEGDPSCKHTSTEIRNKKDADCGNDGYTGDTYCKDCGRKISSGSVIKASGNHKFGDWTLSGSTETRTCSVCDKIDTRSCSHASTMINGALSPTCGEDGYTGDVYCVSCGSKTATGKAIPATGDHSYKSWETVGDVQIGACTDCGKEAERPIPDCSHDDTEVIGALDPTCGSEGYTGDSCCKECGTVMTEGSVIPATGDHKNTSVENAKAPTCAESGYSGDTYCLNCDALVKQGETVPPTNDHSYVSEIISEPTEKKDGLRMDTCSVCGHFNGVILPKTGSDSDGNGKVIIIIAASVAAAAASVGITVFVATRKKVK